jgi:hypothetical protein
VEKLRVEINESEKRFKVEEKNSKVFDMKTF